MSYLIQEGNLSFNFDFNAIKFDDSQYYRQHFSKIQNGICAVDILAVDNKTAYLIEIKDYTHPDTDKLKLTDLLETIVKKVLSSLSAILPMKINASDLNEQNLANLFAKANSIKVFLYIQLPHPLPKLKQSTWTPQYLEMKLKNRLKPIDAHPKVVSKAHPSRFPWTVILNP